MAKDYKNAGVDIKAGEEAVEKIKGLAKSTFTPNVLRGIGLFGSFYELDIKKYEKPVLVSSVDGVGTKLKVAFMMDRHSTVGQDLVNHCVNDIAVCGATPLYFLDYFACGKLFQDRAEQIISGFAKACKENSISLIGGETAEMPGFYPEEEYDLSGTIVGILEKDQIIDGRSIQRGDSLIGFRSNGLHTNGYSLARNVLFPKHRVEDRIEGLELCLGEELLRVHRSYLGLITHLRTRANIKGLSHITGGGLIGNTKRILPEGMKINLDWNSWKQPEIFSLIQREGDISDEEMRKVFNLGIGLVAIVAKEEVSKLMAAAEELKEPALLIGQIE